MAEHVLPVKVYLEDTDAQGIVYHANYLRFCERARTEMLAAEGVSLAQSQADGWTFVVHEMHLKFSQPARLHDALEVRSAVERASAFRVTFHQRVYRVGDKAPLVKAKVQVVTVGEDGKLTELPPGLFGEP